MRGSIEEATLVHRVEARPMMDAHQNCYEMILVNVRCLDIFTHQS